MRKIVLSLILLMVFVFPLLAFEPNVMRIDAVKAQIVKVKAEMEKLDDKKAKYPRKTAIYNDLLDGHRARLEKLEKELKELQRPPEISVPVEIVPATPEAGVVIQKWPFEIGGNFGALAGATCVNAEARFDLPYVLKAANSSSRISLGYAFSRDDSRKYVPLCVDVMLNIPPGRITGVDNYLGVGLNYVLITSGRVAGSIGGQVFYGVEAEGFGGKLFGELGYGVLRTGFSPSHSGVTLLIGYRKS